jgi:hypothetical protein
MCYFIIIRNSEELSHVTVALKSDFYWRGLGEEVGYKMGVKL